MENDSTKGTVIKGPWKQQSKKKVKVPKDPMQTQLQEDLIFAEELTEHLMVQLIHTMGENGFSLKDHKFIRDIGFISECCKSIIFRDIGLTHPLEPIVERLMEKTKGSFIQFTKKELFEMLEEDDGKKKT
jgi:hypothetical protein